MAWSTTRRIPALADELAPSYLRIHFDESVAALELVDKELFPGLVVLDPPLPGVWRWEGDRTLAFKLTGEWPAARTLRVQVYPAALSPKIRLDGNPLETRTPPVRSPLFEIGVLSKPAGPRRPPGDRDDPYLPCRRSAELERHVAAAMLGHSPVFGSPAPGKLFSLTPGRHGREFFLRTVPLTLPPEPDTMKLRVTAGLAPVAGGAPLEFYVSDRVVVPDLYSFFHIEKTSTRIVEDKDGNPHQFLLLETSCQVRSEDLAKSLALYALPTDNPARQAERQSAQHDTADNDHADADADDSDDSADDEDRDEDDHNADETEPAIRVDAPHPSDGWSADEVDAAALARARRLDVTLVPSATETATTHTFRLRDDQPGFRIRESGEGRARARRLQAARGLHRRCPGPHPGKRGRNPGRRRPARAQRRAQALGPLARRPGHQVRDRPRARRRDQSSRQPDARRFPEPGIPR